MVVSRAAPAKAGAAWSAGPRQIGKEAAFFDPTDPPVDGSGMGLGENGNGAVVDAFHAQGPHAGTQFNFLLHPGAAGTGAERFGKRRQAVFHAPQEIFEVFFTPSRSCGRECRMADSPICAR